MFHLEKIQTIALIGFIIILVTIPVSFSLIKKAQTPKPAATAGTVTQLHNVPSTSPISDLNKAVQDNTQAPAAPGNGSLNTAFGPTLNLKVSMEGRPLTNQAAKIFVGIAAGIPQVKPTYIFTFTIDVPASGAFSGLSLAGLNPGSNYTAYVKGPAHIDTAVTFAMGPTETNLNNGQAIQLTSGDLNEDNTIDGVDYALARGLYGTTPASSNWNARADFNTDGIINNWDLNYVVKNTGKTGASGIWYSPPPIASGSAQQATGGASLQTGGYFFWMPAPGSN